MAEQDKQIRLKFLVDDASVQKTRQILQQLTSDLTKFAEMLKRTNIGNSIGGFGSASSGAGGNLSGAGGLLSGGSVGGSGTQAAQTISANPAGQASSALLKTFKAQSDLLTSFSAGSTKAMKTVSDSLKQSVGAQTRDLDTLKSSVDKLTESYTRLGAAQQGATGNTSSTGTQRYSYTYSGAAGGGEPGTPGAPGGAPGGDSAGGPRSGLMKNPLIRAAMAGGATGLIGNALIGGVNTYFDTHLRAPMLMGSMESSRSDVWSGNMRRALHGDMTMGFIQSQMNKDEDARQIASQAGLIKARNWKDLATGGGSLGGIVKTALGLTTGATVAKATELIGTNDTISNTETMQRSMERQAAIEKANAYKLELMQNYQSNMGGKLSWMHATGQDYQYNPHNGEAINDRIGMLQAKIAGRGFTTEEYMGAFGQVQGSGGRRAANSLAFQSMFGAASGITNAGQISGTASIGGGLGSGFMSYLYGAQGGPRGFDPGALGQIGGSVSQSTLTGGIATSGTGTLNAFLSGSGGGRNGPSDMLLARNMQAGLQGLGSVSSGSVDRYQVGMNLVNAAGILGPNANPYSQDYLANKMTPTQMLDIMGGGKMDPKLSAMGLNKGSVTKMFEAQQESAFNRYYDTGTSNPMDVAMRAFRGSGKDLKSFYGGIKGQKAKDQTRAALGDVLASGLGQDLGTGEGMLDAYLGVGSRGGRRSGPRGVSGGKSPEAESMSKMQALAEQTTKETLQAAKELNKTAGDLAPLTKKYARFAEDLSISADTAAESLRNLAAAANANLLNTREGQGKVDYYSRQYKNNHAAAVAKLKTMTPGVEKAALQSVIDTQTAAGQR